MISNKELTEQEKYWLENMLFLEFPHQRSIIDQINCSRVSREYTPYYLSIRFAVSDSMPSIPIFNRVPIEMLLDSKEHGPIHFLLHIIKGYVCELEIYCIDLSPINPNIYFQNSKIDIRININGKEASSEVLYEESVAGQIKFVKYYLDDKENPVSRHVAKQVKICQYSSSDELLNCEYHFLC